MKFVPFATGIVAVAEVNQFRIPTVVEAVIVVELFPQIEFDGVTEITGVLLIVATMSVLVPVVHPAGKTST